MIFEIVVGIILAYIALEIIKLFLSVVIDVFFD